ncbi:hypothetical protein RFF05_17670 [Bengtsoniella intestinalis]|uniref:hypothetical protein n=1 Tax=Bengtsoniella intestinalis TaxID=3073143 RepID=UPI00391F7850
MKTAFNATRLAIAAFIVPYIFAMSPEMLFIDTVWYEVVLICITAMIGIFGVAAGLSGFFYCTMNWAVRGLLVAGGLTLLVPGTFTDVIGLVLVFGLCFYQYATAKKAGLLEA